MTLAEEFRETVRSLLDQQGMTQRELAHQLGVSEGRVSQLLNGPDDLTLRTVAKMGYALGVRFLPVTAQRGSRETVTYRGRTYRRVR